MSIDIAKSARDACQRALASRGYRKRAGNVYSVEVSQDVVGRVALNSASNGPDGRFEINPIVGVHHLALERAVAELSLRKTSTYDPPSLSSSLGYLMPERAYRPWFFADADFEAISENLADAITEFGQPFMVGRPRLSHIVKDLEQMKYTHESARDRRLPVAHALLGDKERAMSALDQIMNRLDGRKDMAAVDFRDYATRFRSSYFPS